MPAIAISALVGAIAGLWVPVFSTGAFWPVTMLLSSSLVWWLAGRPLFVAIIAFALASLHGHWYLEYALPESLVGQDLSVDGVVVDLPHVSEKSTGFLFRVETDPVHNAFPALLALRTYAAQPSPKAGERWRLKVRLKRSVSMANLGGLDYESWLFARHVHARGYVRNSTINRRLAESTRDTVLLRFRSDLRDTLEHVLENNPALPLITGISIGARDGITRETWRILRDSGTGHLIAISGLHIGLIGLACWWPGRLLGWLMQCIGVIRFPLVVARSCVLLGSCSYAMLAGFSIPTMRASVLMTVVVLLALMHRRRVTSDVLAVSLLVVLVIDPLSVLAVGFWLSFIAVALLYAFLNDAREDHDEQAGWHNNLWLKYAVAVRRVCSSQLLLCVGLALPGLLFFSQVSLIAPLANLVAVPLFTFWILPATLTGLFLMTVSHSWGLSLLNFAAVGLNWIMEYLELLLRLPAVVWQPGYLRWSFVGLLLCGVVFWLLPRPFPGRWVGLTIFVYLLNAEHRPTGFQLRIRVLDVGQGLAVLVQTPNHNLLYDTGAAWPGGDMGASIIAPELKRDGVRALDLLVISHDDADHRGGAESVLAMIPTGMVLTSGKLRYGASVKSQKCRRGMKWQWDGVNFEILHPDGQTHWSENDASCVLRVRLADSTALLPGDIEERAEFQLLRQFDLRDTDLLIGPHHGSRTSSGAAFVRELAASYAIFSAGYANRWGFPLAEVLQRWEDSKACVLITAESGALEFVATKEGGFRLVATARTSLVRPWPLRRVAASHCINTIKGTDGTV